MKEVWKPIKAFEDRYLISNKGRVKSVKRNVVGKNNSIRVIRSRILKAAPNKNTAYLVVALWKDNKGITKTIHRLVAETFIPNPNNLSDVNHKDGNKQNNWVDNLEWCDRSENLIHFRGLGGNYKGGVYETNCGKWYGQIYIDGKNRHLGTFPTKEDAQMAVQAAKKKHKTNNYYYEIFR